jgi:hypothetical protein
MPRPQSAKADFVPFQPRVSNLGAGGIVDPIRTATIVRRTGGIVDSVRTATIVRGDMRTSGYDLRRPDVAALGPIEVDGSMVVDRPAALDGSIVGRDVVPRPTCPA